MNSNYIEFKFPQIKGCQWRKVFRNKTPEEAIDFIASTLAYTPENRVKPFDGCGHTFFDELRVESTRLPNGAILPPLFDFTGHELNSSPELLEKVRCCSSCFRIVTEIFAHLVLFSRDSSFRHLRRRYKKLPKKTSIRRRAADEPTVTS